MDLEKLKRIKNLIIAKILFVFGWIYDLAMRILNAVNKTPIEKDKDRRNVRIKQFAIATSILYVIFNSIFIYIFKSMRRVSLNGRSGEYTSTHFMPWNIIVPSGFMMFIFEIILAMVVGLCITVKLHTLWRMKNDSKDIKGDNKFMEDNELLEHFQAVPMDNIKSAEQAGMLIGESNGMYYVETGTYNTMIVGAPRSGKGECYVLPSMRLMANSKNKPSLIINDMKGELLELTYKDFANNGYKIVTLNLIDTDRSDCWNPLQLIIDEYLAAKRSGSNDLSQTSKLVSSFAHCLTDDVQSEAIWTDSARSLLSALIYYFLDKGYEKGDMSNVNMYSITTFFTEFGVYNTVIEDESGNKKMVNALDELFNALPVGCLARTSYSTSKFSQGDTRSSIYTVLSADLEIFMTDMGVQKLTSKNEINFADLINEDQPCIIYMLVPYEEKSRYVIASMFADQSFLYLAKQARKYPGGKLPRKIEYMYDEFGQMTKLPDLSSKMNASPGANILFNLFLQDYGQLKKYEKEEGIKGGCNIQIYILSLNGNTNKAFSEMIGNETVNYLTFSGSLYGFLDHQGERVDSKALLDTTQLSKLPFGTAIVKKMRCEPIKTNITPYHLLPNKMPRIPIDELPIKSRNIDLSAAMYPYDELWDSLGVIGYQYRLDSLKKTAERAMNDYYMQLGKIDQIKSDGSTVSESMYKAALELEKNAGAAQRQVIEYQQQVQKLNEFRANEARKIFAEAYGTSGSDEEDDYTDQDELYFPGEYPDDGPYVDITALLYKINGLVGSELGGFLSDQNYAAARGYIKKIQKRPDIRSNFVADEWAALEQYINNEELKNANT